MPEIYGTAWIKQALDNLESLMTALKNTLATYDYKYSYVHTRHNVAPLLLNAITIGIETTTAAGDYAGISAGEVTDYQEIDVSIRLHTAFVGAAFNRNEAAYLVNSIINKLLCNRNLGDNIDIVKVNSAEIGTEFYNFTKGAEISVTLAVPVDHAQEV